MEIGERLNIVSPELVMEPLLGLLEEVTAVPLVVSGSSMTPFLAPGRDSVYLSAISEALRPGDVVLYRRDNGRYVLHRILRVNGDSYTMVGDAQTVPEPGIRREQILAIVTAVRRKGKLLQKGSFRWAFFQRVWIRMVPLRPLIRGAYDAIKNRGREVRHEGQ